MTIKLSESIKPLSRFLAKEAEKREIPKFAATSSTWRETLSGLAVVIYSQPTNIPIWPDMVIGGIRQIRKVCNSDVKVRNNLKKLAASGILTTTGNVVSYSWQKDYDPGRRHVYCHTLGRRHVSAEYYLNIEIPGELLARQA